MRKIAIEQKPSLYSELRWSPDSTKVALSNRGFALLYVDIEKEESHRVDITTHPDPAEDPFFDPSWSPDSRCLAYTKALPNRLRGIFVHSLESGRNVLITDGRSDSRSPSFDKNGKYLYFSASTNAGPVKYGMSANPFRSSVTYSTYIVLLDKDGDLTRATSDKAAAPMRIDFQNIGERILPLPAEWSIASTNARPRFERKKAPLKDVKIKIDPRAEWRLIYNEAWRLLREYFYDPGHHGEQSRVVTVTPVANESPLRHYDWVTANRRKVDQLSGGKLAYIYLPDTKENSYEIFNREFYAQLDKQGVIIDERFNVGGVAADYIIDNLRRFPLNRTMPRESETVSIPVGVIEGPRVMIINEFASSGGDGLPFMFRAARLGTLVGKRTGGAALGGNGKELLDGGRMTVPDWGHYDHTKGTWTAENLGVSPDVEVDIMPADWRAGRDPQLERAVQVALEDLKKNPPRKNIRPKFPVYR